MRHLAALLLLVLPSCAPDGNAFDVDPTLRVPFEVAARVWCDRGAACVYQAPDGPSTLDAVQSYGAGHETRIGYTFPLPDGASEITTLAGLEPGLTLAVVLHELGHHFGCDESDDPSDVMYRLSSAEVTVPSERDLACATE